MSHGPTVGRSELLLGPASLSFYWATQYRESYSPAPVAWTKT